MKPLMVLILVFVLSLLIFRFTRGAYDYALAARIAIAVMLMFTAFGHFKFTEGMALMLPEFIPYKNSVVILTGFIEIAAAVGLLIPNLRVLTAWLLIVFFILILPANIYSAMKNVNYQNATFDGDGPAYLWFRVPLQLFFIAWVYFSSIKN